VVPLVAHLRGLLVDRGARPGPSRRVTLQADGGSGLQPGVELEHKEALAESLDDHDVGRAPG